MRPSPLSLFDRHHLPALMPWSSIAMAVVNSYLKVISTCTAPVLLWLNLEESVVVSAIHTGMLLTQVLRGE